MALLQCTERAKHQTIGLHVKGAGVVKAGEEAKREDPDEGFRDDNSERNAAGG
jgi:hypothetical protein